VTAIDKAHEADMTFLGFLVLFDPPKPHITETIASLKKLGVALKIINGRQPPGSGQCQSTNGIVRYQDPHGSRPARDERWRAAHTRADVDVFAEIEPNQKERIILALRRLECRRVYGRRHHDASALHAADVGISVESAVDVAKDAADIVLLEQDLSVLVQGVREGGRPLLIR